MLFIHNAKHRFLSKHQDMTLSQTNHFLRIGTCLRSPGDPPPPPKGHCRRWQEAARSVSQTAPHPSVKMCPPQQIHSAFIMKTRNVFTRGGSRGDDGIWFTRVIRPSYIYGTSTKVFDATPLSVQDQAIHHNGAHKHESRGGRVPSKEHFWFCANEINPKKNRQQLRPAHPWHNNIA